MMPVVGFAPSGKSQNSAPNIHSTLHTIRHWSICDVAQFSLIFITKSPDAFLGHVNHL
jgi:hypothetical protein